MGKNLDQILEGLGEGDKVHVTLVTNQDNGIVGYAVGDLIYHAGSGGAIFKPIGEEPYQPPHLSTVGEGGKPLAFFFSDRMLDIDPPTPEGQPAHSPRQPFDVDDTDELGVSIFLGFSPHVVRFTFLSWGGSNAYVSMEPRGNMLVGSGPPLGHSPDAAYVIAFTGVTKRF